MPTYFNTKRVLAPGGTTNPADEPIAYTPPLDNLGSATYAFSTRRLSTTYSGSCLKIRRSSDDATQDIGFTNNGAVDSAAIAAFVGGGSGFVDTWYDQSGNGLDATTTASDRQPQYVGEGVLGVGALSFAVSNVMALGSATTDFSDNVESMGVIVCSTSASGPMHVVGTGSGSPGFSDRYGHGVYVKSATDSFAAKSSGGSTNEVTISSTNYSSGFYFSWQLKAADAFAKYNGIEESAVNMTLAAFPYARGTIGGSDGGGAGVSTEPFIGQINEVIAYFQQSASAGLPGLETNIADYFSIA